MYKIIKKDILSQDTFLMEITASRIAQSALPGQFIIVIMKPTSERIPLTISDHDTEAGTITIVFKAIGKSTLEISTLNVGDYFEDIVGPLGRPSSFTNLSIEELRKRNYLFIGGGVGIAPIYHQVKWLYNKGILVDVIIGARNKEQLVFTKELQTITKNLYITTDDCSSGRQGLVTDVFKDLIVNEHKHYDEMVAIGPLVMMKYTTQLAQQFGIKATISLNSLMVDGTGMCGACRVTVGGKTKFTCVDGPEFDGELVDFNESMKRQAMYNNFEGKKELLAEEEAEQHQCHIGGIVEDNRSRLQRVPIPVQDAQSRIQNFSEVCLGYNAEEAILEAQRCLQCKNARCIGGCPVSINIPAFIKQIAEGNFLEAAKILYHDSALPAVCGRVCPQETQCEGQCILGVKGDPVAIGKLERFVADWTRVNQIVLFQPVPKNGHKVGVIGSGPSGLSCAKELIMNGFDVTVFEALNEYGGVLVYGIPAFRLPKEEVVKYEIEIIKKLGVKFEKDIVVGKTVSIESLMKDEGYEAIFIGSGAGLPNFMNIPGENLCGVVSANEFLTRNNLLLAYKKGYDTPNFVGKKVAVVGGGNVAMDAARTALRLGAEVTIVYRRSEEELPARAEEVHHAKEEGVIFNLLCNPIEILGNEEGWVKGINCIKMQLGEPDQSGRRRPVPIPNSNFTIDVDMVIMSIGTSPNPLISITTSGLAVNKYNCIEANELGETSLKGIYAGGDAVSGAATVILAMGAGKAAAKAIEQFLND